MDENLFVGKNYSSIKNFVKNQMNCGKSRGYFFYKKIINFLRNNQFTRKFRFIIELWIYKLEIKYYIQ